ncbi:PREDICTED: spermatogenic leucine zipper protein 1 [Hipposideros armiger]|uniref:Spermatogenic leucine zipper protein 1 n=1 Tax=Hipposideros armiger TaxID=186990 RepID=A0A8B7R659_HIPAR|nr:PREDICTED: spermatogenic leucine zipper protein 1 [Hipposideros armiger]
MEVPTISATLKPAPIHNQESLDPNIVIALLEIGSLPPISWSSLLSLNNSCQQETEQQTAKTFENLLKEIRDILKYRTSYEEKTTEAKEPFEETNISEDVSELKEEIRGLDKINKAPLKNQVGGSDLDEEHSAKKQTTILESQNSKDTVQGFARNLVSHSKKRRAWSETQLSKEKAEYGFHHVQEGNIKLRNNMEQLLQEAERWSVQHTELSDLMKLYQKSQTDVRVTLENHGVHFQTHPNNEVSASHELEAQVRKLNHDMYSLHLIAALLDNECQFLQKRVELLNDLHHHKDRTVLEEPIQINYEQDKKEQKLSEAEKIERCKQKMQEMEGTFQKRDTFYRSLDACRNKKVRKNKFNTHIARRVLLRRKRPASA